MISVRPGRPFPLGASLTRDGVHFALVSRHAHRVWLQLYDDPEAESPSREFELFPSEYRTGDVWHIEVSGIDVGALYLFRVDGPFAPTKGLRFNRDRPLLDPYAKALTSNFRWDLRSAYAYDRRSPKKDLEQRRDGSARGIPKCIVIDDDFDWQGDRPLNYPLDESIIYEAHVRGISMHRSSEVPHPGTYRGVIEMIPYLQDLGITSLELLPIHEFDEYEFDRTDPITGRSLQNYWGYNTIGFFAPKGSYAADGGLGEQVREFKEMVRELHRAGIEVILDVVFNHTGEGNELGPTFSFRGIDNTTYYMLEENRRYYRNFSGTGNTLNCNHPVLRDLIRDALHYWVIEMHVDGFRFDLGSVLGRDENGVLMENAPILERIAEDPILHDTKIIAEAWDAGGAYQVGGFRGRWAEWNDRFRDDIRRYWRGDRKTTAALATRFTGSSDLYSAGGRKPFHSINFVTAHDGFTLHDLVSYNRKHNESNGEENRDGHDGNFSYNHGVEGPTDDPAILELRSRQTKNFLATLLLSLGTPMLLSGDEFGRTQDGNNNAYSQNNEISWNNYELGAKHGDIFRFTRVLIAARKRHPAFQRPEFYTGIDTNRNRRPDIAWFGANGLTVDWTSTDGCLAVYIDGTELGAIEDREDDDFYIMFNGAKEERRFVIPEAPAGLEWVTMLDTAALPPLDCFEPGYEKPLGVVEELDLHSQSMRVLRTTRV